MAWEYKVVEKKLKSFLGGRMSPSDLEILLNEEAEDDWELDRIVTGEAHERLSGGKDVLVVILRRPRL